jgi:hypothetical protein
MIARLFLGAGLFALGYYLGREVGRAEPVCEELRRAREDAGEDDAAGTRAGAAAPEATAVDGVAHDRPG